MVPALTTLTGVCSIVSLYIKMLPSQLSNVDLSQLSQKLVGGALIFVKETITETCQAARSDSFTSLIFLRCPILF